MKMISNEELERYQQIERLAKSVVRDLDMGEKDDTNRRWQTYQQRWEKLRNLLGCKCGAIVGKPVGACDVHR